MIAVISRDSPRSAAKSAFEDTLARLFAEAAGADVLLVPHIYHIAEDDPVWEELAKIGEPVVCLAWLYSRPSEWILRRHGIGQAGLATFDMGAYESPEQCFEACGQTGERAAQEGTVREPACEAASRWHPVVDYSRCIDCKQCMEFCLFGVYELDGRGSLRVAQPDNCKDGCPACSRVCPRGAIIFPLYRKDEAIAGAPGKFVTPDAAAKKMFEKRTSRPHRQPEGADDELDSLIDDLDRLTQRNP